MSKVWYGCLQNRLEENRMFCDEIKIGTGVTEYSYSDRRAYEIVEVIDQKHVIVREYDHKLKGDAFSNDWELISNEQNARRALERRGKYWYWTSTVTAEQLDGLDTFDRVRLCVAGFDPEIITAKGKQTKRYRANVSFGVADYYYDYEF